MSPGPGISRTPPCPKPWRRGSARRSPPAPRERFRPVLVAHADWSVDPRKRWVTVAASNERGRWRVLSPMKVGNEGSLRRRMHADGRRDSAVLGVDFSLGLPAAYAAAAGVHSFR